MSNLDRKTFPWSQPLGFQSRELTELSPLQLEEEDMLARTILQCRLLSKSEGEAQWPQERRHSWYTVVLEFDPLAR
jgi:hypothetical protein